MMPIFSRCWRLALCWQWDRSAGTALPIFGRLLFRTSGPRGEFSTFLNVVPASISLDTQRRVLRMFVCGSQAERLKCHGCSMVAHPRCISKWFTQACSRALKHWNLWDSQKSSEFRLGVLQHSQLGRAVSVLGPPAIACVC